MKSTKDIAREIFLNYEERKARDISSLIIHHSEYTIEEVDRMLEDAQDSWESYQSRIDCFDDDWVV